AVETSIHAREGIDLRCGAGEPVGGAGRLCRLGGERLRARAGGRAQRARLAQALARVKQLLVLVLPGSGLGDLGELELQQLELALARFRKLVQALELSLQAYGLVVGVGAGAQSRGVLGAAGLVQELQLGGGDREPAVLVLPVEGKEPRAEIA